LSHVTNPWGIELNGPEADQKVWHTLLKPPFDPFVKEIQKEGGNYLALRSRAFDGLTTAAQVHEAGKRLFATLNVACRRMPTPTPLPTGR
jgi:hypothetical protein